MRIQAKCIKETYTWDDDGEQHKFPYVKVGLVYTFDVEFTPEPTYWLDKSLLPNKHDYDFIDCARSGIETKYFYEMFDVIKTHKDFIEE